MFSATLKSIKGRLVRFVATGFAVIIGVAFLTGTQIFTDTVEGSFDDLFATVFDGTDAAVRSSEVIDAGFGFSVREQMDESVVEDLAAVPGIKAIEPFVEGSAVITDSEGEAIGNPSQGPPTLGLAWGEVPELNPWVIAEGRAPQGGNEVVIDKLSADTGSLEVGDRVTIQTESGTDSYDLVGIATFGSVDSPLGASAALFDFVTAQEVFGATGKLSVVSVVAEQGVSQETLKADIAKVLESDLEVLTGDELAADSSNEIAEGLAFFNIFLSVFVGVALVVAAFVIYNTFAILLAQRTRELALFRAVGAQRRQVLGSVALEAVFVGVVGSALGLLAGIGLSYGLRSALDALGLALPGGSLILRPSTIVMGFAVGILVTLFAAFVPSLKASKVNPLEAMRSAAVERRGLSRRRLVSGLVLVAAGGVMFVFGLLSPVLPLFGLGAVILFVGVFVLGPIFAPIVCRFLGSLAAKLFGVTGELAKGNLVRNPVRTARTASALMVGVALVAAITVLTSSLKDSIAVSIGDEFSGDFVVATEGGQVPGIGFSQDLSVELQDLEGVSAASGVTVGVASIDGGGDFVTAIDPDTLFDVVNKNTVAGDLRSLDKDSILLSEAKAESLDVSVGDSVSIEISGLEPTDLEVVGVYESQIITGNFALSKDFYSISDSQQLDAAVYVSVEDGQTVEGMRPAIDKAVEPYSNANVNDRQEFIDLQNQQLDQIVNVIYALLVLAIVIATIGIAITALLSIIERTREIGLTRAVGMTRRQLKRTVTLESAITAIFGAIQGVVIGLFFGYAVIYALRDEGVSVFSVSWASLIVVVLIAIVLGIGAAVYPARRASKLNVLQAISSN